MVKKQSKSDKVQPKSFSETDFNLLREQSKSFKNNKNCSGDDLVPFLGHGGTHKAVKPTASHGDYINADHAPHYSILNYIDNLTLENMPDKLKSKIKELRRLEKLVEDSNAELIKKHPTIVTRGMKKANACPKKAPHSTDNSSPNQSLTDEEIITNKSLTDEEIITNHLASALRTYKRKLYDSMATLSIPLQLHVKMPTTLKPAADIQNLTDENAETAKELMEEYIERWIKLVKTGIKYRYIKDNYNLNQAKQNDLQEKVLKIWEDNFKEILGYWLQFESKDKKKKSEKKKSEKEKSEKEKSEKEKSEKEKSEKEKSEKEKAEKEKSEKEKAEKEKSEKEKAEKEKSEKEKYMEGLYEPYRRMVLCTTIYYVKTPKQGYKRLISVYLDGYKLYLKNFDRYKPGIIRYLETSKDFGWIEDQDVDDLIRDYSLQNTKSRLMTVDKIEKWESFANLIKSDDDKFKAQQELERRLSNLLNPIKGEPVPTIGESNNGSKDLMQATQNLKTIKGEPTNATERLDRIYTMIALMSKDINEIKQDLKQIKEEQQELKIELNHLGKGSLNEQQMTELSPQIGETFKSGKFEIPQLTYKNSNSSFLTLPTGTIYMKDIKTVQPALSNEESNILATSFNINVETANWMVDSVLSGFLFKISDYENPEISCLTPTEVQYIFSAEEFDKRDHLSKCKQILIPFNQNGNHWILIIMKPETKEILVFDPVKAFKLPTPEKDKLKKYFNHQLSFRRNAKWEVKYPEAAVSKDGTEECGPFVCFYAEASVRGSSLMKMPDVNSYREHIIKTLIGSCEPSLANEPIQMYSQSKIEVSDESVCNFCWTRKSETRLRKLNIRNNEYSVCL